MYGIYEIESGKLVARARTERGAKAKQNSLTRVAVLNSVEYDIDSGKPIMLDNQELFEIRSL